MRRCLPASEKNICVGADLLANAAFQAQKLYRMHRRLREQARSHRVSTFRRHSILKGIRIDD